MASWVGQRPPSSPSRNFSNGLRTIPPQNHQDDRSMTSLPGVNDVTSPMMHAPGRNLLPHEVAFPNPQSLLLAEQQALQAHNLLLRAIKEDESAKSNEYWNQHWGNHHAAIVNQLTFKLASQNETVQNLVEANDRLASEVANCKASRCAAVKQAKRIHEEKRKEFIDKEYQPMCIELENGKENERRLEDEKHALETRTRSLEQEKADVEKQLNDDLRAKQNQLDQAVNGSLLKEQELKAANSKVSQLTADLNTEKGEQGRLRKTAKNATEARDAAMAKCDKALEDLDIEKCVGRDRVKRIEERQMEVKRVHQDIDDLKRGLREEQAVTKRVNSRLQSLGSDKVDVEKRAARAEQALKREQNQVVTLRNDMADVEKRASRVEQTLKQEQDQVVTLRKRQDELQHELAASAEEVLTLKNHVSEKDEIVSQKDAVISQRDEVISQVQQHASLIAQLATPPSKSELSSVKRQDDARNDLISSPPSINESAQDQASSIPIGTKVSQQSSNNTHNELTPPKTPALRNEKLASSSSPPPPPPDSTPPPPPPPSSPPPLEEPRISFPINRKDSTFAPPQKPLTMNELPSAHKKPGTEIKNSSPSRPLVPQKRKSVSGDGGSPYKRRGRAYPS